MSGDDRKLVDRARAMLLSGRGYLDDARADAGRGNSLTGAVLAMVYRCPRQVAEAAVQAALAELDREKGEGQPPAAA
ncbi:MAG TPA: hypothetical protein VNJ11_01095 [Bryobacteraceae bacterium]|nr:hypothetical protein [Bryobacteraceae bacterium]